MTANVGKPQASAPELVVRAASGDRSVEAELCARFAPAVRHFARRRLRRDDAVEEFTQDAMVTFLEAVRGGAVQDPARVASFVLGICRNLARHRARTGERRAMLFEMYAGAVEGLEVGSYERCPYELAHLEDCMSQLGERARDVLRFAYVDGDSNGEIAERLAMSEGNVRVVRHRALGALRDCMSKSTTAWEAA